VGRPSFLVTGNIFLPATHSTLSPCHFSVHI